MAKFYNMFIQRRVNHDMYEKLQAIGEENSNLREYIEALRDRLKNNVIGTTEREQQIHHSRACLHAAMLEILPTDMCKSINNSLSQSKACRSTWGMSELGILMCILDKQVLSVQFTTICSRASELEHDPSQFKASVSRTADDALLHTPPPKKKKPNTECDDWESLLAIQRAHRLE